MSRLSRIECPYKVYTSDQVQAAWERGDKAVWMEGVAGYVFRVMTSRLVASPHLIPASSDPEDVIGNAVVHALAAVVDRYDPSKGRIITFAAAASGLDMGRPRAVRDEWRRAPPRNPLSYSGQSAGPPGDMLVCDYLADAPRAQESSVRLRYRCDACGITTRDELPRHGTRGEKGQKGAFHRGICRRCSLQIQRLATAGAPVTRCALCERALRRSRHRTGERQVVRPGRGGTYSVATGWRHFLQCECGWSREWAGPRKDTA